MIRLVSVSHAFDDRPVLAGIDLELSERRIGVIGANGSGKSSFLRLLNGLLLPDTGSVSVDGLDSRRDTDALRRHVGFVFQNPDLQIILPTVEEDVGFGLRHLGLDAAERERRIDTACRRFGLETRRQAATHTLSGGQKQRLALAGVFAMQPRVLVFDEPTTLLDLAGTLHLRRLVADLAQQVVLVTHDFEDLRGFDRVLVFEAGRIVADGAPAHAVEHYRDRVAGALADA